MTKGPKPPRMKHTRVKTAKKRTVSSQRWLERQLNDPFVAMAKQEGYRSRAVYKISGMDEKAKIFKAGQMVIDLGAAPGSWSQWVGKKFQGRSTIIAVDILPVAALPGVTFIQGDFTEDTIQDQIRALLGDKKADVIMSDMAPPTTGHRPTDHLRIIGLVEEAWYFAKSHLAHNGAFICKVWQGGAENTLLADLKQHFAQVRHIKPEASRKDSAEMFLVATGFKD